MSDNRPYAHIEINSPGIREPLDWHRVSATVNALDVANDELSAARSRIRMLTDALDIAEDALEQGIIDEAGFSPFELWVSMYGEKALRRVREALYEHKSHQNRIF
jgi:hypothetical protein